MLTIKDIRNKYPQYSDLSDRELADKLYTNFYSDMDRPEFDKKIGISTSVGDELSGAWSSIKHLPGAIAQTLYGSGKEIVTQPKQAGIDAEQALHQLLSNTAFSPPEKLANYSSTNPFAQKGESAPLANDSYNPFANVDYNQLHKEYGSYQPDKPNSPIGALTKFAALSLPITKAASVGEDAVKALSDLAPEFAGKKALTKAAQLGAGGALAAPLAGVDPEEGAMTNVAIPAILKPFAKSGGALAKMVGGVGDHGRLTPEEFKARISQVPEGVSLPLGAVANSPLLNRIYGSLEAVPFSGTAKPYDQLNAYLKNGIGSLKGHEPEGISSRNQYVFDAYNDAYNQAKQNENQAWRALEKHPEINQVKGPLANFHGQINELLPQLKEMADENPDEFSSVYNMVKQFKQPNKVDMTTMTPSQPSLGDMITVRKKINNRLGKYSGINDSKVRRPLGQLKGALDQDIRNTASGSENPELLDLLNQANNATKNSASFRQLDNGKVSPFLQIIGKPQNSDTSNFINSYLKPSSDQKDNGALLSSLINKLPEDAKNVVVNHYLKGKDNESTLPEQLKRLGKLSDTQKGLLFGQNKPLADQLSVLAKFYPKGKNPGYVPQTGLTGNKLIGAGASYFHPGLLSIPLIARGMASALRNPKLADLYAKSLAKQQKPISNNLLNALRTAAFTESKENDNR